MIRTKGWESRLEVLFAAAPKRAFKWGEHDCLLFACDAVAALLEHDPAATLRGKYKDEAGAYRLLRKYLGVDVRLEAALPALAARLAGTLGATQVGRPFARRGDIASIVGTAHECLAVVDPSGRFLAAVSPAGLVRVPLVDGVTFWAVG